jgi:hypothetical protein
VDLQTVCLRRVGLSMLLSTEITEMFEGMNIMRSKPRPRHFQWVATHIDTYQHKESH